MNSSVLVTVFISAKVIYKASYLLKNEAQLFVAEKCGQFWEKHLSVKELLTIGRDFLSPCKRVFMIVIVLSGLS